MFIFACLTKCVPMTLFFSEVKQNTIKSRFLQCKVLTSMISIWCRSVITPVLSTEPVGLAYMSTGEKSCLWLK